MGEKQEERALFYADAGEWKKFQGLKTVPEFQPESLEVTTFVEGKKEFSLDLSEMSFSGTLKLGKHSRCKSRKRFIKLLISSGMSRNCAVENAEMIRDSGLSYSDAWFRLMLVGGY